MANFETALKALAKGEIEFGALSNQIDDILKKSPQFANRMLIQLDAIYKKKKLDKKQYSDLRRQINQFRRGPFSETENVSDDGSSVTIPSKKSIDESKTRPPSIDNKKKQEKEEDSTVVAVTKTQSTSVSDTDIKTLSSAKTIDPSAAKTIDPSVAKTIDPNVSGQHGSLFSQSGDISHNYHEGSVIKQRFKLEKILGVGGMGKVYKALDLLKAEAKDKHPHVAIKLLNDDFKAHPEAFIALQREASRQQKLAHPNIATIYDFDRVGGPNTPVFITMELMEGMELKDYIRRNIRPAGGLPFQEAYKIISQLGSGLIYAHNLRLVHSDFKPGNAFLCNDGTVKTLDFGIARAVKNPVTGETEKTLFDAGKLGALTPAYASLEMLEGEEPDTRDDIYALGCVSYEILTGKHPFNKLPANKAQDNNLAPPYIKTLNKKQNRALKRSVAFYRADRSPTVAHFLEELEGKPTWHKNPFFIAATILFIIGMMLITPTLEYLHNKKLGDIIAEIATSEEQVIIAKLDEIRALQKTDQTMVTGAEGAKIAIQNYFSDKLTGFIGTGSDFYDFPSAGDTISEIAEFYPGSIFLQEQTERLSNVRKRIIGELTKEYVLALKDLSLIENVSPILKKISEIDPAHPLLDDPRPSNAYRLLAQQKFDSGEFNVALDLINSGRSTETGSQDPRLIDLETKIIRAQRIAQLESELGAFQTQLTTLADFQEWEAVIIELATLKPNSELIKSLSSTFKPIVQKELEAIIESGPRDSDIVNLKDRFGELMSGLQLNEQLTRIRLANLQGDKLKLYIIDLADNNIRNIKTALGDTQPDDPVWNANLLKDVRELAALAKEEETLLPRLEELRSQVVQLYIDIAYETLESDRYDAANDYVDTSELFSPDKMTLVDIRQAIADRQAESQLRNRVVANKNDFKIFTESNSITEALKLFNQLKADLPESDHYILFEAPQMLANSFARLAQSKAETKDYASAFSFVQKGLEIDPQNALLGSLKDEYQSEANILELTRLFKSSTSIFSTDIRLKVSQIENANPARYASFSKTSAEILAERIKTLSDTDESAAAGFSRSAVQLFPTNAILVDLKNQLQLKPWDGLAEANAAITAGKLTKAIELQQNAREKFATHPDFITFSNILKTKTNEASDVYNIYLQDKEVAGEDYIALRTTKNILTRAQALWTDNPDYRKAEVELDQLITALKPVPKPKIRKTEISLDEILATAGTGKNTITVAAPWKPIRSEAECTPRLASYGKRAKAVCYDMVHTAARGPLMVVVPNGGEFEQPFAISKYEISISDWGKYCILSGTCQPIKDKERKNEPLTGITLKRAQDYAAWLSERTGKIYRIPTASEWTYAANAGGKQPSKDFNCRVSIGDKLIKGTGTVSVRSGRSNGWGLKNYVGNVQEWVVDGDVVTAHGGAFTDAHSKCDVSLKRDHNGESDDITGFRLIRKDVG